MEHARVLDTLRTYVAREILDGRDMGLDERTPLLEWGIINSMEMAKLLTFIERQFHVAIPGDQVQAESFQDLTSIADLVIASARASFAGR